MPLSGTEEGRRQLQLGAGGDRTMEVDRAAEAEAFAELQKLHESGETFSVLSEESGLRRYGADQPLVVVDPVDGSLNAKQGIPFFNVMMALLEGPTIGSVAIACVVNLGTAERWTAIKGEGARRNGAPVQVIRAQHADRIELLGLESTPRSLKAAERLVERSGKVRILGSMALSMAHTAAGGLDAFCAPLPMRVFDMAASVLIIDEAGGVATDTHGRGLGPLECSLATRTTLLCAPDLARHALAMRALTSTG